LLVPVKANSGVMARVAAAGKVLEGDDKPTLSALYYDSYAAERKGRKADLCAR